MTHCFPNLELVYYSMSGSNCCFSTCTQISQEAGKVAWYSHLFTNFPPFIATPCTAACQGPLSMEFSRQEYWRGQPFPSQEDLPNLGTEARSLTLWTDSSLSEPPWKCMLFHIYPYLYVYIYLIAYFEYLP